MLAIHSGLMSLYGSIPLSRLADSSIELLVTSNLVELVLFSELQALESQLVSRPFSLDLI